MTRTLSLTVVACALLAACASGATAQRFGYEPEERAPRYIASASAAADVKPTPVAILKQVNRHNEDGSYTYGYESADGSFKIETKLANGEVKGKYGYRDDTGKVRTIEYGANKFGFQPSGEGITVAPPTLVDESAQEERRAAPAPAHQQGAAGGRAAAQYRPAPQPAPVDYDYEEAALAPAPRPQPAYRAPQPAYRAPQLNTLAATPPRPPKATFFPGAAAVAPAPVSDPEPAYFRPQQQQQPQPAPAYSAAQEPKFQFSQNFQPQPNQYSGQAPRRQQYSAPPAYAPPAHRPAPSAQREPFSMLDQLIKEYGLPQGGAAPLHDITFGSY